MLLGALFVPVLIAASALATAPTASVGYRCTTLKVTIDDPASSSWAARAMA
jgi:hypothetical protein